MDAYNIKNFLNDYSIKTKPLFKTYFAKKLKEASLIGHLPLELLGKFAAMAEKGKKVRGALIVLGYQLAQGKDLNSVYDVSLFLEILHTGLLVHDDIMDQDNLRRGLPTLHNQFNKYGKENAKSLAICAGDLAFYLSWEKLLNSNFSEERIIKTGIIYSKFARNVIYGQVLDLTNNIKESSEKQDIINVFRHKTAEYTGVLPLLIGATLGGLKDQQKLRALEEYGLNLGWAFQIHDDILGLYGDDSKMGKPVGSDLKKGKITFFIYYALKNCSQEQIRYLKTFFGNTNLKDDEIPKIRSFFKEIGALEYVKDLEMDYIVKGKKAIPKITDDKHTQKLLTSLLQFIVKRTK